MGEYGSETSRPHFHAIVFNSNNVVLSSEWRTTGKNSEPIGNTKTDQVNDATIHYVTGYILHKGGKMDNKTGKALNTWSPEQLKPYAQMSKGLGKIYLKYATKFHKSNMSTVTFMPGGEQGLLPRYYRDKIFTKLEKQEIGEKTQQKLLSGLNPARRNR